MRKRGFTLVEILIVIVIIGILIGALVPRMQSAQGRARDVARKNDLSQIQSAILVSFQDKGVYPCQYASGDSNGSYGCESDTSSTSGLDVSAIKNLLTSAGINSVPSDPLKANQVVGLGNTGGAGEYRYMTVKSNNVENGGFVLMARTEIEGGSNRVVCDGGSGTITKDSDTKKITLCSSLTKGESENSCSNDEKGTCIYGKETELRYILVY